jgi:hypothetical protein
MPYVTQTVRQKWALQAVDRILAEIGTEYDDNDIIRDVLDEFLHGLEDLSTGPSRALTTADLDVAVGLCRDNNYTRGDLNYIITRVLRLTTVRELKYIHLDAAVQILEELGRLYIPVCGTLRCVELELYRRLGAPYEDLKAIENGDVY